MAYRLYTFSKSFVIWKYNTILIRNISLISSSKVSCGGSKPLESKLMNFYFKKLTRLPSLKRFQHENDANRITKFHSKYTVLFGTIMVVFGGLTFGISNVLCEGTHRSRYHEHHPRFHRHHHHHRRHSKNDNTHLSHHHSSRHHGHRDRCSKHSDVTDDDVSIRHRRKDHGDRERHDSHHHSHNRCEICYRKPEPSSARHSHGRSKYANDYDEECQNVYHRPYICDRCARKAERILAKCYSSVDICKQCNRELYPNSSNSSEYTHAHADHDSLCDACYHHLHSKHDKGEKVKERSQRSEVPCYQLAEFDDNGQKFERFDWNLMWQSVAPDLKYLGLAIASALAIGLLNIEIPLIIKDAVSMLSNTTTLFGEEGINALMKPGLKLLTLYLAYSIFSFSHDVSVSVLKERIRYRLSTDLFEMIIRQDIVFFDVRYTGELLHRLTSDVQTLVNSFIATTTDGLNLLVKSIGSVVIMFMASPKLSAISCITIPTFLIMGKLITRNLRKLPKQADEEMEKSISIAEETISNIRAVRVLAKEETQFETFENHVLNAVELKDTYNLRMSIYKVIWNLSLSAIVLSGGYMGFRMVQKHEIEPGDMISFIMAVQLLRHSLTKITLVYEKYVEGLVSGARVFEYFHRNYTIPLKGGDTIPLGELCGDIEFKDLTFSYPCHSKKPVFTKLNLKIPKFKTFALCGKSGGGKSSLANLLVRLYDADEGSILIDGKDVKTLDPEWLRGYLIGYVMQEPVLFAKSVMENIRCARPDATDEEVIRASKLANAHGFIMSWKNGYDTILGERGVDLSGGQRKRIAIARALVKDPCILIVDEVTSALDSESENIVLDTLKKISKGRTVIILTHCGDRMDNVDLLASLDKGEIVELGSPKEVEQNKGFYYEGLKHKNNNQNE